MQARFPARISLRASRVLVNETTIASETLTYALTRNVGFLRYFRPEQIPNFVLALPLLVALFAASWTYYSINWPAWLWQTLPFLGVQAVLQKAQHPFLRPEMLPHIHLHTILTLQLFFFSHVQIVLRQALTNPVLFWFLAYLYESGRDGLTQRTVKWSVVSMAVSAPLWTAFYPPA